MIVDEKDGFWILTFLRGEQTAEVPCRNRAEAEELLFSLTLSEPVGVITTSDKQKIETSNLSYDVAEMWKDGEMVALGLRPNANTQLT